MRDAMAGCLVMLGAALTTAVLATAAVIAGHLGWW